MRDVKRPADRGYDFQRSKYQNPHVTDTRTARKK
jgi:hypothetical protein